MRKVKIMERLKVETARANGEKCRVCPKYQFARGYCPILAQFRKGDVAACKYGKLLIAQERRKVLGAQCKGKEKT